MPLRCQGQVRRNVVFKETVDLVPLSSGNKPPTIAKVLVKGMITSTRGVTKINA